MAWMGRQRFPMGSDLFGPEERPAHEAKVAGFWIDPSPVTNAEFADFVADTGYLTLAEREPSAREHPGACWHRPAGPGSSLEGLAQHTVVHVAHADAAAYACWAGKALPIEREWECAARAGLFELGLVWHWTNSPYRPHSVPAGNRATMPRPIAAGTRVVKGGSHRPSARRAQPVHTSAGDLGFRCVVHG
ncbi:MAG: SUMF1/EgtB/PvdO family nonheme iron enzyme [Actinophytocola sp.]|nr:SUMF1/EgtB/PvdO family nonheme iron enzyme [Actinophytocola sp.]